MMRPFGKEYDIIVTALNTLANAGAGHSFLALETATTLIKLGADAKFFSIIDNNIALAMKIVGTVKVLYPAVNFWMIVRNDAATARKIIDMVLTMPPLFTIVHNNLGALKEPTLDVLKPWNPQERLPIEIGKFSIRLVDFTYYTHKDLESFMREGGKQYGGIFHADAIFAHRERIPVDCAKCATGCSRCKLLFPESWRDNNGATRFIVISKRHIHQTWHLFTLPEKQCIGRHFKLVQVEPA